MDGRFLEAFTLLPRQRVVCGRVTKPLCLRHRIVLEAINSPFVDGKSSPTAIDVVIFSKVVSSLDMAYMTSEVPSNEDKEWLRKMVDDEDVFLSQVAKCYDCISEQSKWPVFWNKKNNGKSNGVPWVLSVVCNLVKNGVPLEQAWTMPESQAIWMNAAMAISGGSDIDIVSEEDLAMQAFLEKLEADKKAKEDAEAMEELSNV